MLADAGFHGKLSNINLGQLRIAGLDNIGEALALAEGEAYK